MLTAAAIIFGILIWGTVIWLITREIPKKAKASDIRPFTKSDHDAAEQIVLGYDRATRFVPNKRNNPVYADDNDEYESRRRRQQADSDLATTILANQQSGISPWSRSDDDGYRGGGGSFGGGGADASWTPSDYGSSSSDYGSCSSDYGSSSSGSCD